MSTFLVQEFLLDSDGNYVTDSFGNKIILNEFALETDPAWRAIGGQTRLMRPVLSFNIELQGEANWRLRVNQDQLVGLYPSQEAAFSVLYGMYTRRDGSDEGFTAFLEESLSNRGSEIASDRNNVFVARGQSMLITEDSAFLVVEFDGGDEVFLSVGGLDDLIVTVTNFDADRDRVNPGDSMALGYQTGPSAAGPWTDIPYADLVPITAPEGGEQEAQFAAVVGSLPNGSFYRGALFSDNGASATAVQFSTAQQKSDPVSSPPTSGTWSSDTVGYHNNISNRQANFAPGNVLRDELGMTQMNFMSNNNWTYFTFEDVASKDAFFADPSSITRIGNVAVDLTQVGLINSAGFVYYNSGQGGVADQAHTTIAADGAITGDYEL